MKQTGIHVVKLGGSLLDMPDLQARFDAFRRTQMQGRSALIVGGGPVADHVRRFDTYHHLGDEIGHWLAVRAMQLNTYLIAATLHRARLVTDEDGCIGAWGAGELAVVDPLAWLEDEHRRGVTTPHRWSFTSDAITAHVATRLHASAITLLKSTLPDGACDVAGAAGQGIVDADFEAASASVPGLALVNLRVQPPTHCVLR